MTDEEKKWRLGVSVDYKDNQIDPSLKISDKIDDNQDLSVKVSRNKISADYELRF